METEDEARCADAAKLTSVDPATNMPKRRETILRLRFIPVTSRLNTVTWSIVSGVNSPSMYNPKLSRPAMPRRRPGMAAVRWSVAEERERW